MLSEDSTYISFIAFHLIRQARIHANHYSTEKVFVDRASLYNPMEVYEDTKGVIKIRKTTGITSSGIPYM